MPSACRRRPARLRARLKSCKPPRPGNTSGRWARTSWRPSWSCQPTTVCARRTWAPWPPPATPMSRCCAARGWPSSRPGPSWCRLEARSSPATSLNTTPWCSGQWPKTRVAKSPVIQSSATTMRPCVRWLPMRWPALSWWSSMPDHPPGARISLRVFLRTWASSRSMAWRFGPATR